MFDFRPGPLRSAPVQRQILTQSAAGTVIFQKVGDSTDGDLVGVTAADEIIGRISQGYTALCAFISTNRYYCQIKDPNGTTVATVISNAGAPGLPAAAKANAIMNKYLGIRVSGTWSSTNTMTPTVHTNFTGGRGPSI